MTPSALPGSWPARRFSPGELLDAALARLDQVNPRLNAVMATDLRGMARAAIDDGLPARTTPGRAVPAQGHRRADERGAHLRRSSRLFKNSEPAAADSALVAAYRRAGLVLFHGKTNTPEFGMSAATETVAFGIR